MDSVFWVRSGSIMMFLAVALGAFGAHALKNTLSADMKAVFETGVRYQAYHALGLFAAAWIGQTYQAKYAAGAAVCFLAGTFLFSGSLYALALSGIKKFGAITPLGGLLFLIGWILLAIGPYKNS